MIESNIIRKYIRRGNSKEIVKAMKYIDVNDFNTLYTLIGDVYPTITPAHTRVYENRWIVRHQNNNVDFICCEHGDNCFEKSYELYK